MYLASTNNTATLMILSPRLPTLTTQSTKPTTTTILHTVLPTTLRPTVAISLQQSPVPPRPPHKPTRSPRASTHPHSCMRGPAELKPAGKCILHLCNHFFEQKGRLCPRTECKHADRGCCVLMLRLGGADGGVRVVGDWGVVNGGWWMEMCEI